MIGPNSLRYSTNYNRIKTFCWDDYKCIDNEYSSLLYINKCTSNAVKYQHKITNNNINNAMIYMDLNCRCLSKHICDE